jgi:DNA-binding PadR family transcriptional regulator
MAPVFAHGRLRLYLLKLLDEAPRHGYEVIRLLEERFQGLYAPSAGTVYPRLAKLEKEGLVSHSTEGGRKVYALTDEGRAELRDRADEIAGLEAEIRESVSILAAEIREDVRGAAGDLRREVRAAAQQARTGQPAEPAGPGRQEQGRQEQGWQEQAQRAEEESRRAKEDARDARRQAKAARDEVQRIARQVQEQVQTHTRSGDWQAGLREGLAELTRELGRFGPPGGFGRPDAPPSSWGHATTPNPANDESNESNETHKNDGPGRPSEPNEPDRPAEPDESGNKARTAQQAEDGAPPSSDPLRDLERLLDRFRDDIRDTARDRGVTDAQLRQVRRHLSTAAAHIAAALHDR